MTSDFQKLPTLGQSLRLQTLVTIRWFAVVGQTIAVLLVAYYYNFEFPLEICLLLIAASAWLNIFLRIRYRASYRLTPRFSLFLLSYDVLQLAGLLYLTGGLQNPFAMLLVAPVIVSATTQPAAQTVQLGGIAVIAASVLSFYSEPLPWSPAGEFSLPIQYVFGSWIAITSSLIFIAIYAFRVADEARNLADALAATELVLQREQHISTLDGLAAAAAHELGTPLATIALVSKELIHETKEGTPIRDDAMLLRSQAERCREILQKLTSLSEEGDEHIGSFSLSSMIEEISAPHRDFDVDIKVSQEGSGNEPVLTRNPGIVYGLGNLVENAVDFAKNKVFIHTHWDEQTITLEIVDNGEGYRPETLERIGEPYITSRNRLTKETGGGLGLGLFIAKTLLERSGATLQFQNSWDTKPDFVEPRVFSGAHVTIRWPRSRVEHNIEEQQIETIDASRPSAIEAVRA